jgi:hypothetical protein
MIGTLLDQATLRKDGGPFVSVSLNSNVTANIYKINFHDVRHHVGELSSKQTQSNTYMFELKLTTRNDGIATTPRDWKSSRSHLVRG